MGKLKPTSIQPPAVLLKARLWDVSSPAFYVCFNRNAILAVDKKGWIGVVLPDSQVYFAIINCWFRSFDLEANQQTDLEFCPRVIGEIIELAKLCGCTRIAAVLMPSAARAERDFQRLACFNGGVAFESVFLGLGHNQVVQLKVHGEVLKSRGMWSDPYRVIMECEDTPGRGERSAANLGIRPVYVGKASPSFS